MTARPTVAERVARLRALTPDQAMSLLVWLDATAPRAMDKALDYQAATGPAEASPAESPAPRPSWSSWCSLGVDEDFSSENHARCRPHHGPCACACHSAGGGVGLSAVHSNESPGPVTPADVDDELAAVDAMEDGERRQALEHLTGFAPLALAVALDRVIPGWRSAGPADRRIQVGDIMRASYGVPGGPSAEKEVTVGWVSDNGHRVRSADGEPYQAPDLTFTGRTVAPADGGPPLSGIASLALARVGRHGGAG